MYVVGDMGFWCYRGGVHFLQYQETAHLTRTAVPSAFVHGPLVSEWLLSGTSLLRAGFCHWKRQQYVQERSRLAMPTADCSSVIGYLNSTKRLIDDDSLVLPS